MRVFIIDTSNVAPELRGGIIGVEGSPNPGAAEKQECIETVSHYVMHGWAIAADPRTPIGWLAALTAETGCVPFVNLTRLAIEESELQPVHDGVGGWTHDGRAVPQHGSSRTSATMPAIPSGFRTFEGVRASKPARKHNV